MFNCFYFQGMCSFGAINAPEITIKFKIFTDAIDDISFFKRLSRLILSMLKLNIPWKTKKQWFSTFKYRHVKCSKFSYTSELFASVDCLHINHTILFYIDDEITLREISDFYSNISNSNLKWTYIEKSYLNSSVTNISVTNIAFEGTPTVLKEEYQYEMLSKDSLTVDLRFSRDEIFYQQFLGVNLSTAQIFSHLELIASVFYNSSYFNSPNYTFKLVGVTMLSPDVHVKLTKTNDYVVYFDWDLLKIILTYLFMGLSSVLLLTVILIQRYFKQTNNPTRKLSTNVMVCMLLSHLLFMLGFGANAIYIVCFTIGVMSHYAWLCCFSWITLHMVLITKRISKLRTSPNMPQISYISIDNYIIGYGIPLMIVIPSVLLDLFSELKVGYGSEVCFPSVFPSNIAVFIAPVTFTILINTVASIVSGRFINLMQQDILKQYNSMQMRSYLFVYTRFFIFSGSSWLLGIIAELINLKLFEILFIVLAGSNGFFFGICMLISLRRQVRKKH